MTDPLDVKADFVTNEIRWQVLEANADANGEISYSHVIEAGFSAADLDARGWEDIPDRAGIRRKRAP